jgi:hypothetical protein
MMLLNSTATPLYFEHVCKHPAHFGYFISIRKRGVPGFLRNGSAPWAADNDCFNENFSPRPFVEWLATLTDFAPRCLFVVAPDVVGDAKATLSRFPHWHKSLKGLGFPVAPALQDGITSEMVPWDALDAVFVGGTTEWKMSQEVIALLVEAGERGLWRHIGRVNSKKRMYHFWDFAESFDGTGFAIEPDGKLKYILPHMRARAGQRRLKGF